MGIQVWVLETYTRRVDPCSKMCAARGKATNRKICLQERRKVCNGKTIVSHQLYFIELAISHLKSI